MDIIQKPFAVNGNKSTPPQTDPNGYVNFDQGYTSDYEINLSSGNPQAKGVERAVQNYLFNQLTEIAQVWQQGSVTPWIASYLTGYPQNAVVYRVDVSGKRRIYRSLTDNNLADPINSPANWEYQPSASELIANIPMPAGGAGGSSAFLIGVATDFNALTTGTYEIKNDTVAASCTNIPFVQGSTAIAGLVESVTWANGSGTNYTIQRFLDRNGNVFTRTATGSSWTNWTIFATVRSTQAGSFSFATDTGVANAMVVAPSPALSSRSEGMVIRVKPKFANTGATTLNDGLGAVPVVNLQHQALGGGELQANGESVLQWAPGIGTGSYVLVTTSGANAMPSGSYGSTPAVDDNTNKLATTAYFIGQASNANPAASGTADPGTSKKYARGDHVHPIDTTRAPLDSPQLLGNPSLLTTPLQFDSSQSIASTAFVQRALGNYRGAALFTNSATLGNSELGKLVTLSGTAPYTITLPLSSAAPDGASFMIQNLSSGNVTVIRQGTDNIVNAVLTLSIVMLPGDYAIVTKFNGAWYFMGSTTLGSSAGFAATKVQSGYQKLPSGIVIQWGLTGLKTYNTPNQFANYPFSFPIQFPSGAAACVGSLYSGNTGNAYSTGSIEGLSLSGATFIYSSAAVNNPGASYIAIGW
jgi:hypothetical protein